MNNAPPPIGSHDPSGTTSHRSWHLPGPDDGRAQILRFVAVGVVANVLYAVLFIVFADAGSRPANLVGALASSALANELHRRLTFRAGGRVTWVRAQWEGGGLALVGLGATTVALGWVDAVVPTAGAVTHLVVVAVVTGLVGLGRFVALRWLFAQARPTAPSVPPARDGLPEARAARSGGALPGRSPAIARHSVARNARAAKRSGRYLTAQASGCTFACNVK